MDVRLGSGEEATVVSFNGTVLTLHSPRAFAPGSPIQFATVPDDEPRRFEGRTIGSRRARDDAFEVRLRLINLRRADRELLVERFGD